ncbi:hypothetical protein CR970_01315 [Candidatus Saccharibacteria bacterium]|nr:MAG: hypothetical protein CR970_01315 [Candidatus Saccharibacteria bacterium]
MTLTQRLELLRMKVALSAKTLLWLLRKWRYALLALGIALLFFELVYWLFNLGLLGHLLASSALSWGDKLSLFTSPFSAIGAASGHTTLSMMILLSIIQGIALSALTFAIRHQPKVDSKLLGGSTALGLLAVIGLGCPACGTSLITPIIATVVSGSAVAVSEKITAVAMPLAIVVGIYGLYVLGLRVSAIRAQADQLARPRFLYRKKQNHQKPNPQ